ncbi:MAG: hypothetical protein CM15mP77_4250 [Synechococcus sp.]|nr:MAG: hypothetical protein CM15mP77_4250 [Synechococcus sp.]
MCLRAAQGNGSRSTLSFLPPMWCSCWANDVVNPQAKNDSSSPLYGMPVLDVQEARTVFVVKRGMSAGYRASRTICLNKANTSMVFGDAKKVLGDLLTELKDLGLGKK